MLNTSGSGAISRHQERTGEVEVMCSLFSLTCICSRRSRLVPVLFPSPRPAPSPCHAWLFWLSGRAVPVVPGSACAPAKFQRAPGRCRAPQPAPAARPDRRMSSFWCRPAGSGQPAAREEEAAAPPPGGSGIKARRPASRTPTPSASPHPRMPLPSSRWTKPGTGPGYRGVRCSGAAWLPLDGTRGAAQAVLKGITSAPSRRRSR